MFSSPIGEFTLEKQRFPQDLGLKISIQKTGQKN